MTETSEPASPPPANPWRRLDRYLLTHAPDLWLMRIHHVAVAVAVLSLLAIVYGNAATVDLRQMPDVDDVMTTSLVATLLLAAAWAIAYKLRATPVDPGLRPPGLALFYGHWACILALVAPSFIAPAIIDGRFTRIPQATLDAVYQDIIDFETARACFRRDPSDPRNIAASYIMSLSFKRLRASDHYLLEFVEDAIPCRSKPTPTEILLRTTVQATGWSETELVKHFADSEFYAADDVTNFVADRIRHRHRIWCRLENAPNERCRIYKIAPPSDGSVLKPSEFNTFHALSARPTWIDLFSWLFYSYFLALLLTISILARVREIAVTSGLMFGVWLLTDYLPYIRNAGFSYTLQSLMPFMAVFLIVAIMFGLFFTFTPSRWSGRRREAAGVLLLLTVCWLAPILLDTSLGMLTEEWRPAPAFSILIPSFLALTALCATVTLRALARLSLRPTRE